MRLIEQVYREAYGIEEDRITHHGLREGDGVGMYRLLLEFTSEVKAPREGDIILIRSNPWHVGLVICPGMMLHSYSGGSACIENYEQDPFLRNRVEAFYRYRGYDTSLG